MGESLVLIAHVLRRQNTRQFCCWVGFITFEKAMYALDIMKARSLEDGHALVC